MALAVAVIGAVATVAGTLYSNQQQKKAAKASQKQQELSSQRSRRQAIRAAQISRAQAVASAQASGSLSSSSAQGGIGSLSSQLGSELGFASQMSGLSQQISKAQSKAADFNAVAGLGGAMLSFGVNRGADFSTLFSPKPTTPAQAMSYAPASSLRPRSRQEGGFI